MSDTRALDVLAKPALILRRDIPVDDVVRALAPLPSPQQALAIRTAYTEAVDGLAPGEAEYAKEQHGRRIEEIVDGLEPQALLGLMVEAGDSELLLDMVRGRVGEMSTAVQHLSARHFAEFFMSDADMNRYDKAEYGDYDIGQSSRLVQTAWTFIMETPLEHNGVNLFFLKTERGQKLVRWLEDLAAGNEDAKQIVARLREREHHLILDDAAQAELDYIEEMEEREARRLEGAVG